MSCANFDEEDQICIMCHMGRVERQQSCFKAAERAVSKRVVSEGNLTDRDGERYCDAVQKVLDVLCGVCGKCNEKGVLKND